MPVFALQEIVINKDNLFAGKNWNTAQIEERYAKFGGSIRFWGTTQEGAAWDELKRKVNAVANLGTELAVSTTNLTGSIVHVCVEFDQTVPTR